MRPSLPLALFDLCRSPGTMRHRSARTCWPRAGTEPYSTLLQPRPPAGLLLIGGPSAHFGWDDAGLRAQIAAVLAVDPAMRWTLTTSRRTPASF